MAGWKPAPRLALTKKTLAAAERPGYDSFVKKKSPAAQLAAFMKRYDASVAAVAKAALTWMRRRLPGAVELVYDNYNALVIGFGPSERASEAIFSIALY